jgi:hypothetical protein
LWLWGKQNIFPMLNMFKLCWQLLQFVTLNLKGLCSSFCDSIFWEIQNHGKQLLKVLKGTSTHTHIVGMCGNATVTKETWNKFTLVLWSNKLKTSSTQLCSLNRFTMHDTWITMIMGHHGLEHFSITLSSATNPFVLETTWKQTRNERLKVHEMEQLY